MTLKAAKRATFHGGFNISALDVIVSKATDKGIACAAGIYRADFKCRDMHFLECASSPARLSHHGRNNIIETFFQRDSGRRQNIIVKLSTGRPVNISSSVSIGNKEITFTGIRHI